MTIAIATVLIVLAAAVTFRMVAGGGRNTALVYMFSGGLAFVASCPCIMVSEGPAGKAVGFGLLIGAIIVFSLTFLEDLLLDPLRPRWKHSDPEVRAAAVERLTDQRALAKIARRSDDSAVRVAAVEKLASEALLAEIAGSDEHASVRKAAVERLEDRDLLAQAARSDEDHDVRKAALEKVDDQALLARVAMSDEHLEVSKTAVEKLEDQALLTEVARNGEFGQVCLAAAKMLNDPLALAELVEQAWYEEVRAVAVRRVEDQELLARVARNDGHEDVRKEAARRLTDREALAGIAGDTEECHEVRRAAADNPHLDDRALVAKLDERQRQRRWKCPECGSKAGTYLWQSSDPNLVQIRCKGCDHFFGYDR